MKKSPFIIASSLLGLTFATTSYAVDIPTTTATTIGNTKPALIQKSEHEVGKQGKKPNMKGDSGIKRGMMGNKVMQDLNLTAPQKTQIKQLRTQNQAKMQQMKAQLEQMDANIAVQKGASASTATLLNLYKQKQTVMDQFFSMQQQQKQQFMNILTPEQQLKRYESQNERRHGMKNIKH